MEDVVLHYRPGSVAGLSSLLETTEKLLEAFPCRTPPVFTSWFPTSATDRLPIRPAKPAPVITSSANLLISDNNRLHTHTAAAKTCELQKTKDGVSERHDDCAGSETIRSPDEKTQKSKDALCISETPNHLLPLSAYNKPESRITRLSPEKQPQKDKDGFTATDCPVKRCWRVCTQRGVVLQSSQLLSKQFHHMVSIHSLHLRQRAKWVISEDNCGAANSIEEVWQTLSRSVRNTRLPTCNVNIQRERAEIWVFCDVLYSEQVGRFLKNELQLTGKISLSVHRLGNVFSM
ncbi:shieldin complex subunit 3 [Anabas testudineus]|uniref:Shieldin complex subunit 3 n=1 Tax=Anabas testudineus TaxID=64144 RepID=A0A3Q1ICH7_ANATE|nr:shieldin complex subunit 3 [Anabas testudineus]